MIKFMDRSNDSFTQMSDAEYEQLGAAAAELCGASDRWGVAKLKELRNEMKVSSFGIPGGDEFEVYLDRLLATKERRRAWAAFQKSVAIMSSYPSKIGWKIISDMSFEGIQGRGQAEIAKLPMARLLELT
jgi:hypothetical protein